MSTWMIGRATSATMAATAMLTVVLVGAGLLTGASPAAADPAQLLSDSFTHATTSSDEYVVGGSSDPVNTACLTVPGSSASATPASCSGATDADGDGTLRLTPATNSETGFLLYDRALPTKAGLDISYNMYQYGGNGADGITFFLSDGQYALTSVGAKGGSLGYHNSTSGAGSGEPGVPHALLGVAFDAFGNFVAETNNASCNTSSTWTGVAPEAVAVRGPGVLKAGAWNDGYCLLAPAVKPTGGLRADTRATSLIRVRIRIDPPTDPTPMISVYLAPLGDDSATAPALLTQVPEPTILQSTPTFKFGWAASTGGSTDIHAISTLQIATVKTLPPAYLETTTSPATTDTPGSSAVTFRSATKSSDGPIVSGEQVTQNVTIDSGLTWGTLPSDPAGWVLESHDPTHASYRYTPTSEVLPGTQLPDLTLPVSGSTAGSYPATSVLDDPTIDPSTNPVSERTATSHITLRPAVTDASGQSPPAAASPQHFTVPVTPATGGGTPVYSIVTAPPAAAGSATIDPSNGAVTFTPKSGASGITPISYVATTGTVPSIPATVTVSTAPAVMDKSVRTPFQTTTTVNLATGAEGTGLSYQVVGAPPASSGSASISGATLTFVPATGFTGTTTMTYRARDAAGLFSDTATVTVVVSPAAVTDSLRVSLDSAGAGSESSHLPPALGTAPFVYSRFASPSAGILTVQTDGRYNYIAANSLTGVFTGSYEVVDSSTTASDPAPITITVAPYAGPVSGATTADTPVALPVPSTVFASSGVFAVIQPPSGGVAAIDPATGVITFTPTANTSGVVNFGYTVTANTVTSDVASVSVTVDPTANDKTVTTNYGVAKTVDLTAGARGTSLSYAIVSAPGSAGTAALDAATGSLVFTPASRFSGVARMTFRATDPSLRSSSLHTVTVTVLPSGATASPVITIPANGTEPVVFTLPAPSGTGPFSYAIPPAGPSSSGPSPAGPSPAGGSFVIDPATGVVTFTPTAGTSGPVVTDYTVTDGAGNQSPPVAITVTVLPYAAPATGAGDAGSTVHTLGPPNTVGSGPLVYAIGRLADPTIGRATIDPVTGVVTFIPADPSASGPVVIDYTVTDVHGLTSAPTRETLTIRPTVPTVSGSGSGALAAPDAVVLTPKPSGTGPFTFRPIDVPKGLTVVATPTGFVVTPAPGFSGSATFTFVAVDSFGTESSIQLASLSIGVLAVTGARGVQPMIVFSVVALLAGFGMLVVARRRRAELSQLR